RPKGVLMHHRGISNYFQWGVEGYGAAGGNGAPVFSSMAVDLTLTNFLPLFVGGRVVLVREGPGIDALAELLEQKPRFSLLKITPTHLALLNERITPELARSSTHVLVIGADNLLAETTLFWQEHAPDVVLLNEYGPTETVVGCSIHPLVRGKQREGPVPIGRPIDNITMYVLDGNQEPVPIGVPGELYIGGIGVARGYHDRAALTAKAFVPDPFAATPGARLYRTGDRARWRADGELEFLGRVDHQVKIRGYRIEIGEIETVLSAHPQVREVFVMAREDGPGERRLVAYVVAEEPAPTTSALRQALKERLPDYMIPQAFVFLEALPLASSGKVDRQALPAPDTSRPGLDDAYTPPTTPLEHRLVRIWEAVLGVRPIGTTDNFFDIGGSSIVAVRLLARIRKEFGRDLPLTVLVNEGTIRGVADWLGEVPVAD
ncbi:MAG: non-ribosomal peptide synthetase, partial [Actinobacteria bacterium]|nr:non-ribosomal peptide synthetase [Actinomycetota bacterium]NIU17791.1 non-ribosomal peptide synthetase [Actinomycetota bacterium]NIU64272.1 non-ribosomal peptide synthetase [Actinomycetota bacterium]NIW26079.1 AMP-binding protein [Actinomycetota bacterium]